MYFDMDSNFNFILNNNFFREDYFSKILFIPLNRPPIKKILNVNYSIDTKNIKLIPSINMSSNEGVIIRKYKLIIKIKIELLITYISSNNSGTIHALRDSICSTMHIVLPEETNGLSIFKLFKCGKIKVNPLIESITLRILGNDSIFESISVFCNVSSI